MSNTKKRTFVVHLSPRTISSFMGAQGMTTIVPEVEIKAHRWTVTEGGNLYIWKQVKHKEGVSTERPVAEFAIGEWSYIEETGAKA